MKTISAAMLLVTTVGCVSSHCQQPMVSGGLPIMGATASVASAPGSVCEATPAIGMGWETVSFRIPKPRLFAVPRPQAGPQVVGVPILTGGPSMTMGMAAPMAMASPMMAAPMAAAPQGNAAPQGDPSPQSSGCNDCNSCAPACNSGCAEGCNSEAAIRQECDALLDDISCLQRELCIQTKNATIQTRN